MVSGGSRELSCTYMSLGYGTGRRDIRRFPWVTTVLHRHDVSMELYVSLGKGVVPAAASVKRILVPLFKPPPASRLLFSAQQIRYIEYDGNMAIPFLSASVLLSCSRNLPVGAMMSTLLASGASSTRGNSRGFFFVNINSNFSCTFIRLVW